MKNIFRYEAMVLSCMDPRFQKPVYDYLKKQKLSGKYSSFTIAGAAIGVAHPKFKKWHSVFLDNLAASIKLHKINKLIVINHYDCGAAKMTIKKKQLNNFNEIDIHLNSFKKLKNILKKKFPKIKIEFNIFFLNKIIKKIII